MNTAIATLEALKASLQQSAAFCSGKPQYEDAGFIYTAMISAVQVAIDMLEKEQQK